jgi:Zn-dependent peptidase ImmA (M78 family)
MFQSSSDYKPMKFSAYCDGAYYESFSSFIGGLLDDDVSTATANQSVSLPYISQEDMEMRAANLLSEISYQDGAVDLSRICDELSLKLEYMGESCIDGDGNEVLGEADFEERCIKIYPHNIRNRERFTIAHEIGHFYLGHGEFLGSESVVENDLFIGEQSDEANFYCNMEFQANSFASCLLLPAHVLLKKIFEVKVLYEIPTHRYLVYVDDQPCNIKDYNLLMNELVGTFGTTKTAIEVRLRKLNYLTDNREKTSNFKKENW